MSGLELFMLGPLDIHHDGQLLTMPPTLKSQSLLAYLVLHRQQAQTRERLLSRLDERAVGRLDEFFANLLMPRVPSQSAFLNDMMQMIWTLGRDGYAVLLGRGANWILEARYGLRIRLTAEV